MNKHFHEFFIPVLGVGFSLDTPIKVARYNIASVISLIDDELIEIVREYYCEKYKLGYSKITNKHDDHRAERIKAYLNLMNYIVKKQIEEIKKSEFKKDSQITKYFNFLPANSPVKKEYTDMLKLKDEQKQKEVQIKLRELISPGAIEVNIMVKLDKDNYKNGQKLTHEYSDAMSALRGFAGSDLESGIVFSSGLNRKLFSYLETFDDFFAKPDGKIKKKIILKVSDFRSALTQAKFFAKKGLWISEYRVESGLNCGGHAFPTNGNLLGPVLEEFKTKKESLISELFNLYNKALSLKKKEQFKKPHSVKFSLQGGIGTAIEHDFMLKYYNFDSIGWGSPFLLVPDVVNVDEKTLDKLVKAGENDIYLSDISPLNVPFYTLRNSDSEEARINRIKEGNPGILCKKSYLALNTEFTELPICISSRRYQKKKIEELKNKNLPDKLFEKEFNNIVNKACICKESADSLRINYSISEIKGDLNPCVCPGPNLTFFSNVIKFDEMINHIYGRINLLKSVIRPHVFINELKLYIDYFKNLISIKADEVSSKNNTELNIFKSNLFDGIEYYKDLIEKILEDTELDKKRLNKELMKLKDKLLSIVKRNKKILTLT